MEDRGGTNTTRAARTANAMAVPEQGHAPSLTLPKGAGALRSIDEKFTVNAVNGTIDLSVPLPFSPARSALQPTFSLQYNSGQGNGLFGLGWGLSLPTIQRKTDQQLPRYRDADETDVFVLAGAEDLVRAYSDASGTWVLDEVPGEPGVQRYRPRIEGAFARIEKITVAGEPTFFWKVTTRDNVTTVYGRTAQARIANPDDPRQVFRWMPEWSYDSSGNCVTFIYKGENLADVPDVVEEQHRHSGLASFANNYLKRIQYGNTTPYFPSAAAALDPPPPVNPGYLFETVFDFGEHNELAPTSAEQQPWRCRFDPFSDCRAGFELRTYRLCRRILFFHSLKEMDFAPAPALVRSIDLQYQQFQFDNTPYASQEADFVTAISRVHYRQTAANTYERKSWPALRLTYQPLSWNKTVRSVSEQDIVGAPAGVSDGYQWFDLFSDGAPGIFCESADAWFYKSNLGGGKFGQAVKIHPKPSFSGVRSGTLQLQDLDADGCKQLVALSSESCGIFALGDDERWLPFRHFDHGAEIDFGDPNARFIDLNGDGKSDLLLCDDLGFRWYPSLGTRGFGDPEGAYKPLDEALGPAVLFADGTRTIFIADMNGDGLAEIVRVRNGDVCYWPNLGYGRFGAKVTMRDAPWFDRPEAFDPSRVRLADISGTGAMDLIYVGEGRFTAWINFAGNAWSGAQVIDPFPPTPPPYQVSVLDLLGNGTACVVWWSDLPADASAPIRYIDLMGGRKPYILTKYDNSMGKQVAFEFKSSTQFALLDKLDGRPWVTKLPFPTMCLTRVETRDAVSGSTFAQQFRYRHGHFDHFEREFRGFGMIEHTDVERFGKFQPEAGTATSHPIDQPPVRTRTWYHTGAYINGRKILDQFADDYYSGGVAPEAKLPDAVTQATALSASELREMARACKGMKLREEVYADDDSPLANVPYRTSSHNCNVQLVQPAMDNPHAVFRAQQSEAVTYQYDRNPADPRVLHEMNTVLDDMGNVLESASIAYGRREADPSMPSDVQVEQARPRITYVVNRYTNDVNTDSAYRVRQLCETRQFELSGVSPANDLLTIEEMATHFQAAGELGFEDAPHPGSKEKRLLRQQRTLFAKDADVNAPLPLGTQGALGLTFASYRLAYSPTLLQDLYAGKTTDAMLSEGKYFNSASLKAAALFPAEDPDGSWWARSAISHYPATPEQHFYLPDQYTDEAGSTIKLRYFSDYHLLLDQLEDALGNKTTVTSFDFRFLQPTSIVDVNDNISEVRLDTRGLVAGMALRGKGDEADDLTNVAADLTAAQIDALIQDPVAEGAVILNNATARFVYRLDSVPTVAVSIQREAHAKAAQAAGIASRLQYKLEYSDGLGRVAMTKSQAEPGKAKKCEINADGTYAIVEIDTWPNVRWIGSGRRVTNNKLNVVMQYEPYFSTTPAYESAVELVECGVTPIFTYDALNRLVRTDFPDGTFARVEFAAWSQTSFDQNDNVKASDWYAQRLTGALGPSEQAAALNSELHDSTPVVTHFDPLARGICVVQHNQFRDSVTNALKEEFYETMTTLDITGNRTQVRDPRGNVVMKFRYDMLDRADVSEGMDAGVRRTLKDVAGNPLYGWDSKGNEFHTAYDILWRPAQHEVVDSLGATTVYEKSEYGTDKLRNQNTRLVTQFDKAGTITQDRYDFKGNVVSMTRQFTQDPVPLVDWTNPAAIAMQPESYTTQTAFDALNRVTDLTAPDGTITRNVYGESGSLAAVSGHIERITHDAKGQRQQIAYVNGMTTTFTYDPQTFRLRHLRTVRATDNTVWQDLSYTYDPIANVTQITDDAQQTLFFNNTIVQPKSEFVHDAVYRLVSASGREHIGQQETEVNQFDEIRMHQPHRADPNAMRNYRQRYEYDRAGNMTKMIHFAGSGSFTNRWTREFTPASASNRLDSSQVTTISAGESYVHDAHGNIAALPGLPALDWDSENHLHRVDLEGGGSAYYTYDASGQRARKSVRRQGTIEERLYVGAYELYTRSQGGATTISRQTVHIMDGQRRLAMIDTLVGEPSTSLTRYQHDNHLGSAALELDANADFVSYEEYYPYGSTSFQSVDGSREVPAKRYRYTGKERDEESGLYYHGARYYAPWIARWISADPSGLGDGVNLYTYCGNNPVRYQDPSGRWHQDMHFVMVYWTGRIAGAEHEEALLGALASQAADDLKQLVAPRNVIGGWVTHDADRITRTRNLHALGLNFQQAESFSRRGIQNRDLLAFGLGLHTIGDWRPHANLSGAPTSGHQEGVNLSGTASHFWSSQADVVSQNRNKALETVGNFLSLWSSATGQPLDLNAKDRDLLEQFVLADEGKALDVFRRSGFDKEQVESVLRLANNPKARLESVLNKQWDLPDRWNFVPPWEVKAFVDDPVASKQIQQYLTPTNDRVYVGKTTDLSESPLFWKDLGGNYYKSTPKGADVANPTQEFYPTFRQDWGF